MKNEKLLFSKSLNIPMPEKILYCIEKNIFDYKEEAISYCNSNNISIDKIFTMEYIRVMDNQTDIIKETFIDEDRTIYLTAIDENGFAVLNEEKSYYNKECTWDYIYGSISYKYDAFRQRGIIFEKDIYEKIENEEYLSNTRILKKVI